MATKQVNTQFSADEAIMAILNATKDGGLPIEDRVVLLASVVREQQELIVHLRLHLRDESQVNALNTETLRVLKQAVCTAAWALAMPGTMGAALTGLDTPLAPEAPDRHTHTFLQIDAYQALAALAALDTSGYAPMVGPLTSPAPFQGPHPKDAGNLIEGTGTGAPPVPPRYGRRRFGYQSNERGGACDLCREPPDTHLCPAVPS